MCSMMDAVTESEIVDIINESFTCHLEVLAGESINIYGTVCDGAAFDTVRCSKVLRWQVVL